MVQKNYLKEIIFTVITFLWLLFVATNVNPSLGQTYLQFTLGSLALLIIGITVFDKNIRITFQKSSGGYLNAILVGLGGWIVLLIASVIVLRFVDPANATLASVLRILGATTPALATSKIANLLTFGVAVAFIETVLWGRLMEFFGDILHLDINRSGIKKLSTIFLMGVLSLVFVLFHLTAKGLTNLPSLIVVFVMMNISLLMVAYYGEIRQAVFLHIWANVIASYLILFA